MKICCICKQEKDLDDFNKHSGRKDGHQSHCRVCDNLSNQENHQKNKERDRKRNQFKRLRNRKLLKKLKDEPCTDCGIKYASYIMQFDHVRGIKKCDMARIVASGSIKSIMEEREKCDLVCANCHAERTHKRKNGVNIC